MTTPEHVLPATKEFWTEATDKRLKEGKGFFLLKPVKSSSSARCVVGELLASHGSDPQTAAGIYQLREFDVVAIAAPSAPPEIYRAVNAENVQAPPQEHAIVYIGVPGALFRDTMETLEM